MALRRTEIYLCHSFLWFDFTIRKIHQFPAVAATRSPQAAHGRANHGWRIDVQLWSRSIIIMPWGWAEVACPNERLFYRRLTRPLHAPLRQSGRADADEIEKRKHSTKQDGATSVLRCPDRGTDPPNLLFRSHCERQNAHRHGISSAARRQSSK